MRARESAMTRVQIARICSSPIWPVQGRAGLLPDERLRVARIWTNPSNSPAEVDKKGEELPEPRIYRKSPMNAFIYFDSRGVTRDFSCLEG